MFLCQLLSLRGCICGRTLAYLNKRVGFREAAGRGRRRISIAGSSRDGIVAHKGYPGQNPYMVGRVCVMNTCTLGTPIRAGP